MGENINATVLRLPAVKFIAEKQGPVESEFKSRLIASFRNNFHLRAAYLLLVRYGGLEENRVALGLVAEAEAQSDLANAAISEFKQMFNTTESLDIIFLTPDQERMAISVAQPFYKDSRSPNQP